MTDVTDVRDQKNNEKKDQPGCPFAWYRSKFFYTDPQNSLVPWTSQQTYYFKKIGLAMAAYWSSRKALEMIFPRYGIDPLWGKRMTSLLHALIEIYYPLKTLLAPEDKPESLLPGFIWDISWMLLELIETRGVRGEDGLHHCVTLYAEMTWVFQAGKTMPVMTALRDKAHAAVLFSLFLVDPFKDISRILARLGMHKISALVYKFHVVLYFFGRVVGWPLCFLYNIYNKGHQLGNPLKSAPDCVVGSFFLAVLNWMWFKRKVAALLKDQRT